LKALNFYKMEKKIPQGMERVKLKDGRVMNYMHGQDGRHVFLGDVRVMSVWLMALVIFILITTILIGFYQITLMSEIGNSMLQHIQEVGAVCGGNLVLMPTSGVIGDGYT